MTIYSLKCHRCNKINCTKFYRCVHCKELSCEKCLDETNPNRLKYKVMKNDKHGIEQTIYCNRHCSKQNKFCNDCGGEFSNLRECNNCLIHYCSDCNERNMEDLSDLMIPGDDEYNIQIKEMSSFYCSKSCFKVHYINGVDSYNVCHSCGEIFIDIFNHGDCRKCMELARADLDVSHNFSRSIYKEEILKLLKNEDITEKEINELVNEFMKDEIDKNDFIEENKINFSKWVKCIDGGASNSLVLYDNCIVKILEKKGIKLPDKKSEKFKKLSPLFKDGTNIVC